MSVLDGAIWSSGTISPVPGSAYWVMLWWLASSISSMRAPVWRRNSTAAQAQNARCSARAKSARCPAAS